MLQNTFSTVSAVNVYFIVCSRFGIL